MLCGITLAVANFAKIILIDHVSPLIALAVCLTIILTLIVAQVIGSVLPIIAQAVKIDPAVMASPLITTIVDATSLLIYFNVAKLILKI